MNQNISQIPWRNLGNCGMLLSNFLIKGRDKFSWMQIGGTCYRIVKPLSFWGLQDRWPHGQPSTIYHTSHWWHRARAFHIGNHLRQSEYVQDFQNAQCIHYKAWEGIINRWVLRWNLIKIRSSRLGDEMGATLQAAFPCYRERQISVSKGWLVHHL